MRIPAQGGALSEDPRPRGTHITEDPGPRGTHIKEDPWPRAQSLVQYIYIYRYLLVPTPLGRPVVEGSKPMVSLEASLRVHPAGRQNRVTVVRFQMGSLTLQ